MLSLSSAHAGPVTSAFWSAVEVAREGTQTRSECDDASVIGELGAILKDAVRLEMMADVPLGAFLSGGIDSSLVVALMQAQSSRPVKTFTIGFNEDEFNEAQHAKKIARHLGTEHTELYLSGNDALKVIPLLASMYDEPFADSSQIPTYMVSKLAREHVTVSLSGDGGDEVFGGYSRYFRAKQVWNITKRIPGPLARTMAAMIGACSCSSLDRLLGWAPLPEMLKPPGPKLQEFAALLPMSSPDAFYLRVLSEWTDPSTVVLGSHEPDTVARALLDLRWVHAIEEMAMLADLTNYLPDDILTKVDRASMAVSLETRVPLLDHRVIEYACRLPLRFKMRGRVGKWALRQVLYRYVPRTLVERPKMGFSVPINRWLRGPLREWAEELLSPNNLAQHGFFAVEPIRRRWEEHVAEVRNWDTSLWPILIFQDWLASGKGRNQSETPQPQLQQHRANSIP